MRIPPGQVVLRPFVPLFVDPIVHQLLTPKSTQKLPKLFKNIEKSLQDGPRGRQDGAKTFPRGLPEAPWSAKKGKKSQDGITDPKVSMYLTLLDLILEAQGRTREAQDPPKRGP